MAEEEASNRAKVRAEDLPFVATYYFMIFLRAPLNASSRASLFICVCWLRRRRMCSMFLLLLCKNTFYLNASKNRESVNM